MRGCEHEPVECDQCNMFRTSDYNRWQRKGRPEQDEHVFQLIQEHAKCVYALREILKHEGSDHMFVALLAIKVAKDALHHENKNYQEGE